MRSAASVTRALLPDVRTVALTAAVASVVSIGSFLARPSTVRVDGKGVALDVPPVTHAHEVFVPLRAVGTALGATITFDPKTGVVEVLHRDDTLRLRIGDRHATIDGNPLELSHAPFTVRGRLMVSRDVIAQAFNGSSVQYDPAAAKIDVLTPRMIDAGAQLPPSP